MFHPTPGPVHAIPHRWRTEPGANQFVPAIKLTQGDRSVTVLADDVDGLYEQLESTLNMFGRKPSRIAELEEQVKSWRGHARKHEDRWKRLQEQGADE